MDNKKYLIKKVVLRCISIFLIIFSVLLSLTWKDGYCIGDNILTSMGLKAWSNGIQGTHYTALYSLTMLLVAFLIYSMTTKKILMTFSYFLMGLTVIFILSNIVF